MSRHKEAPTCLSCLRHPTKDLLGYVNWLLSVHVLPASLLFPSGRVRVGADALFASTDFLDSWKIGSSDPVWQTLDMQQPAAPASPSSFTRDTNGSMFVF